MERQNQVILKSDLQTAEKGGMEESGCFFLYL